MILGITGSFGCGKSTVLASFSRAGWHVFDADACCRALYERPSAQLRAALAANGFGAALAAGNGIDRKQLARIAFADSGMLERLTQLVHPPLFEAMEKEIRSCRECGRHGAFELPLLCECGKEACFDAVLTVWAAPEIRCRRLRNRGFGEKEFHRREAHQMNPDEKLERADFALINNGSEEGLQKQISLLLARFSQ